VRRIVLSYALLLGLTACQASTGTATRPAAGPPLSSPSPVASPSASPSPTPPTPLDLAVAAAQALQASSPEDLAQRIEAREAAVRTAAANPATVTAAARAEQAAVMQLARTPDWDGQVLPKLSPPARATAEANVNALRELTAISDPITQLPHWAVADPAPPEELLKHYRDAAAAYGIDWRYLAAINLVETQMGRIHGLSSAGAMGPMQFMPATWAAYGRGDVNNPRDAIFAAARYLKASGAPGNMDKALYSYNNSNHYVRAIKLYAGQMDAGPHAYLAYHSWMVFVGTERGPALLETGFRG
jgi:membrane-bound lytic murein transglycosylase B